MTRQGMGIRVMQNKIIIHFGVISRRHVLQRVDHMFTKALATTERTTACIVRPLRLLDLIQTMQFAERRGPTKGRKARNLEVIDRT